MNKTHTHTQIDLKLQVFLYLTLLQPLCLLYILFSANSIRQSEMKQSYRVMAK